MIALDLLDGPDALLGTLPELRRDDWWLDDDIPHGGVLVDLGRTALLFSAREGPSAELRHRAAALALIRAAWPGWTVRPLYDGPAELRTHLGLDPEHVRRRGTPLDRAPFLAPDDEELAGPDPGGTLVTLDTGRCHVASAAFDHPVREGPALLDRLADAPDHGTCRLHVSSGLHLDLERRRLDWWSLPATPQAYEVPRLWPGWTVRFHRDDWQQHARRAPARFAPAPSIPVPRPWRPSSPKRRTAAPAGPATAPWSPASAPPAETRSGPAPSRDGAGPEVRTRGQPGQVPVRRRVAVAPPRSTAALTRPKIAPWRAAASSTSRQVRSSSVASGASSSWPIAFHACRKATPASRPPTTPRVSPTGL
ncbi:hypothetical protein Kpho02_06100 [Kitasatospora phosalacinea]|uniref:Uncharacterized protein n=1 Tax=Kitasatospora phosalacinea TaxID=2065 RepID=A0A9W6UY43_9ACTN|nr:hypothetical protein Kpho02_06100 [Kitasatospora phosalacinea]